MDYSLPVPPNPRGAPWRTVVITVRSPRSPSRPPRPSRPARSLARSSIRSVDGLRSPVDGFSKQRVHFFAGTCGSRALPRFVWQTEGVNPPRRQGVPPLATPRSGSGGGPIPSSALPKPRLCRRFPSAPPAMDERVPPPRVPPFRRLRGNQRTNFTGRKSVHCQVCGSHHWIQYCVTLPTI